MISDSCRYLDFYKYLYLDYSGYLDYNKYLDYSEYIEFLDSESNTAASIRIESLKIRIK